MSQNSATPPPYGGPQTGLAGRGTRFFTWMRSIGIERGDGWLGGVCAGLANRIGIDPLIVRGVVVVAALLGAPLVLLYAIVWALLPDREGRIHMQRLFDGAFEPPIVAIGVMLVISLLPWEGGFGWFNGPFGMDLSWAEVIGRAVWTLIVLGAAVALILVAVRNSRASMQAGVNDGTTSAASPSPADVTPENQPTVPLTTAASAVSPSTVTESVSPAAPLYDTATEPTPPPAPVSGASQQDVADWQARQAQWKADHAQWKRRLAEDMRAVKAQRAAEVRTQAAVATEAARAQRAAYRAANPRAGAAVGWLAIGLALVAGALTSALWTSLTGVPDATLTASLAAATTVFGATVLIAGFARRRSGFLIFLGLLLAAVTALSALTPIARIINVDLLPDGPVGISSLFRAPTDSTPHVAENPIAFERVEQ